MRGAIAHNRCSIGRWCRVARMTMPFLRLLPRKRFSHRSGGAFARAWSRGLRKIRNRGGGVADSGPERPRMPMPSASEPFNTWDGLGRFETGGMACALADQLAPGVAQPRAERQHRLVAQHVPVVRVGVG